MNRAKTRVIPALITLILGSPLARAHSYQLQILNPYYRTDGLQNSQIEVHDSSAHFDSVTHQELEHMVSEAGIQERVSSWGYLDKSTLFLRASYLSPQELRHRYPDWQISELHKVIEISNTHRAGDRL
jgi:hypothetical protein